MLDKMKQLYQVQKQAREMQKELKETEVEAKGLSGAITAVVNGELKLLELSVDESLLDPSKKQELEKGLKETIGEAMNKAQAIAADKSRAMMKAMNVDIPGL